jgi:hypothetical protein
MSSIAQPDEPLNPERDPGIPELPAEHRRTQLVMWCVHCKREHYHGDGTGGHADKPVAYGHRAAHCSSEPSHYPKGAGPSPYLKTGYELVPMDEAAGDVQR